MTDLTAMSAEELENRKAELTRARLDSQDEDEKAQLREEIRAIEREERRRDLQAGEDALDRVDQAARKLSDVQSKNPQDAISAGVRGVRSVRDELSGRDRDRDPSS